MTSHIEPGDTPINNINGNRLILAGGGAFSVALSIVLAAAGLWLIPESHQRYADWLSSGSPVIVAETGITIFYGIPLLLLCLLGLGFYGIGMAITGRRNPWIDKTLIKPVSLGIIIGVVFMFFGKYVGNTFWSNEFHEAGYIRCDGSFSLTSKWSADVWALNPSICMDPSLKDALRHPKDNIYEVNQHYTPPTTSYSEEAN